MHESRRPTPARGPSPLAGPPIAEPDDRETQAHQLELPADERVGGSADHQRGAALLERGETEVADGTLRAEQAPELRISGHQARGLDHSTQTDRGGADAGELAPDGVRPAGEESRGQRRQTPAHGLGSGGGDSALDEGDLEGDGVLKEAERPGSELGAVMGANGECGDLRQQLRSSGE